MEMKVVTFTQNQILTQHRKRKTGKMENTKMISKFNVACHSVQYLGAVT